MIILSRPVSGTADTNLLTAVFMFFLLVGLSVISKESTYYIVKEKDKKLCPVSIGPRNNFYTVIYGNFKVGEKLIPSEQLKKLNLI